MFIFTKNLRMYSKITIVVATKLEVEPLLAHFEAVLIEKNLYEVKINHLNVHILITGMGILSTSAHLSIYSMENNRDLYINMGIAGAFDKNLTIGQVLHVNSETYGDFGVEVDENFADFFDLGFLDKAEDAFQYGKKEAFGQILKHKLVADLEIVSSVTVNKVHGNPITIEALLQKYQPQIENMEGLAFYYVCHLRQIDCVEFRSISNYVEKRDKEKWDIQGSISNLNNYMIKLIKSLGL